MYTHVLPVWLKSLILQWKILFLWGRTKMDLKWVNSGHFLHYPKRRAQDNLFRSMSGMWHWLRLGKEKLMKSNPKGQLGEERFIPVHKITLPGNRGSTIPVVSVLQGKLFLTDTLCCPCFVWQVVPSGSGMLFYLGIIWTVWTKVWFLWPSRLSADEEQCCRLVIAKKYFLAHDSVFSYLYTASNPKWHF